MTDHFSRITNSTKIVSFVPVNKERQITFESERDGGLNDKWKFSQSFFDLLNKAHQADFFDADALYFFRCISRREMAAGVTPEIRAACPIVSGFTSCNF